MHTLTIKTAKPMVLISVEEYESLKETIEVLSCQPKLKEELKRIRQNMDAGEHITFDEFKKKVKVA